MSVVHQNYVYWWSGIRCDELEKSCKNSATYEYLVNLIDNKRRADDADALCAAVECLFDLIDEHAMSLFMQGKQRDSIHLNMFTWIFTFIVAILFLIDMTFADKFFIYAVIPLQAVFWISDFRTKRILRRIRNDYVNRKATFLVASLKSLGYEARIVKPL